jgi:hypothetical protein
VQGQLAEFSLAHLLQFFALAERSGVITIRRGEQESRLFVESERVTGWGLPSWDVRDALLACERLTEATVEGIRQVRPRDDTPGLSFILRNLVEPQRWTLFVQRWLEQDIYPLLNAEDGDFEVVVQRCPPAPLRLNVPVSSLILDGSRWESELEAATAEGFGKATVWQRTPTTVSGSVHLTGLEWLVWSIADREQTIDDVATRLGTPVLATVSAIRRLATLGYVVRVHADPHATERDDTHGASGADHRTVNPPD